MGKLGEAICCFTEVTLIGCWGHTSEKRIIFCFCTHFVNIHSGINTTTSELKKKRSKLITFTCIFFQDTRHGHHIITLLYMFPFFPISTLKSTLWVWPVSIGCSMPHRTLSYPYFCSGVCFIMQLFSIFLWTFHCGHCLLLPHVLHLKTRWLFQILRSLQNVTCIVCLFF